MARHHRQHQRPDAGAGARTTREVAIARLRARLLREGFPRLQMSLIVALTGGAGLLASWLLQARLPAMALRYPLAVALAYVVFFALLWLWLRTGQEHWDHVNLDLGGGSPPAREQGLLDGLAGRDEGGGDSSGRSWLDGLGGDGDGDAWPLLLVLLLLAALLGVLALLAGIVWGAPVLFAEMLFDGVLAAGLYRHLRRQDVTHWTTSALRRTALPFGAAALLAAALGAALAWLSPGATTLAQAFGG